LTSASIHGPYFGLSNGRLFCYYNGGATGLVLVNTGAWTHVVITHDGTTATFYVNGVLDRAVAQARTAYTNTTYIAASPGNPADVFPGSLDEVALYPVALTPTQIAKHYALRLSPHQAIVVRATSSQISLRASVDG